MTRFAGFLLVLCAAVVTAGATLDDMDDLSGGAMICHHPAGLEYTSDEPAEGWCSQCDLTTHEDQNPSVPASQEGVSSVWFLVGAWQSEKHFAVFSFGFGDYDSTKYVLADWGPCDPGSEVLEFSSEGWPGPNDGTTVGWTGIPWEGNYVPLYWFGGYSYGETTIPIVEDPSQHPPFCGFVDTLNPPTGYTVDPERRGVLGVGTEGTAVEPGTPVEEGTWSSIKALYR